MAVARVQSKLIRMSIRFRFQVYSRHRHCDMPTDGWRQQEQRDTPVLRQQFTVYKYCEQTVMPVRRRKYSVLLWPFSHLYIYTSYRRPRRIAGTAATRRSMAVGNRSCRPGRLRERLRGRCRAYESVSSSNLLRRPIRYE